MLIEKEFEQAKEEAIKCYKDYAKALENLSYNDLEDTMILSILLDKYSQSVAANSIFRALLNKHRQKRLQNR